MRPNDSNAFWCGSVRALVFSTDSSLDDRVAFGQFSQLKWFAQNFILISSVYLSNFLPFLTIFDKLESWKVEWQGDRQTHQICLPLSFEFKPAIWEWRISESDFSLIVNLAPEKSWQIGDFLSYRNHRCGLCESHPIWFCNDSNCGLDSTVTPTRDKLCWAFSALSWHRT